MGGIEHTIVAFSGATLFETPFKHWQLENVFSTNIVNEILKLNVTVGDNGVNNTRNVSDDLKHRSFLTKEFVENNLPFKKIVDIFLNKDFKSALEEKYNLNLSGFPHLRIEYAQDTNGFSLDPHTDQTVKAITIVVYLTEDKRYIKSLGTEMYFNKEKALMKKIDFISNSGLIFIPDGKTTWHGFTKVNFDIVRRSLIINYVSPDWRDNHQLY